jgi:hypothetical protein
MGSMALAVIRQAVSPVRMGPIPGFLSRAMSRQASSGVTQVLGSRIVSGSLLRWKPQMCTGLLRHPWSKSIDVSCTKIQEELMCTV